MNDMEIIDMSDTNDKLSSKKNDKFMLGVYISLIVLVCLGLIVYFFGYEVLKPFIRV